MEVFKSVENLQINRSQCIHRKLKKMNHIKEIDCYSGNVQVSANYIAEYTYVYLQKYMCVYIRTREQIEKYMQYLVPIFVS